MISNNQKMVRVNTVYLTQELHDFVQAYRRDTDQSLSEAINESLNLLMAACSAEENNIEPEHKL